MKKRKLILFCLSLIAMISQSQTNQENLDKYWSYRDRLRKDFLKIGNEKGESIPMTSRRIDWAFQNQNDSHPGFSGAGLTQCSQCLLL